MIKQFVKHSFIYTFGNILTRGIGIFLIPIYTRYLSPTEYGIIDLFSIIASLISLTIALEISQAIARYYQDVHTQKEKAAYTSTAFIFTLTMYGLYIFISILFQDTFTVWLLDDIKYRTLFILATLAIATNGIFYFTQNQLKWQIQPKDSVMVSIVNVFLIASISIYLLVVQNLKIESIFIAQIIGNTFSSFLSIFFTRNSYRSVFVLSYLKKMLHYSYPLVFSSISVFVALYIDRIMIKEFLGLSELGIYGIAYRFASITGILMIGFQQSLTPLIFKHYKDKNTPAQISKVFNIFVIFALTIYMGSVLFSKEIILFLTTSQYSEASTYIPFLVLILFLNNMYIFFPGLSIVKKTKLLASLNFFGAIINSVFNYILVQRFGLDGIVFATLLSSFIVLMIRIPLSNHYYRISYEWKKIFLLSLVTITMGYVLMYYFHEINTFNLILKFLLIILTVISFIIILEPKQFKKIFSRGF